MTRARFSYSEIRGSKLAWQLPTAYRSLQRPSSASSAKASTGCPLQLAETMLALAMEFPKNAPGPTHPTLPEPEGPAVRHHDGPESVATFKATQCAHTADGPDIRS
jgi:hypothetical protein